MTLDEFQAAAAISGALAQRWHPALAAAMAEFGISNSARIAAFVAQTGHETLGFTLTRELWGPTAAQRAYEPPSGKAAALGNVQPGDGRRFLGRGLIQITGRANYRECGNALGADLEREPERLEQAPLAARSAAWWWARHGCNLIADSGDFTLLTRRINGGVNGLEDRMRRWAIAKKVMCL
ncbi:glycoside hydrolase family 19 protein [Burkholderia sp. AU30280]|uniref:glycoside hydrolase family 19 protein n=1 Tax=Burkholderia sp. AU30280 TaxID=2879628 RepID=UPI001CF5D772|nr:glycoside hydrolase family 19 protein [Burkholderia sp. AU30280]MCA8271342.1 glycoside hydrolase family 19 protein [Burkholderia sp. AU30280]